MRIARDDCAVKLGCCDWCGLPLNSSTQRIRKDIRVGSLLLSRRAADVISQACFTAMTGDHHDELPAMNLSVVAVALTPSCLVWILTVMPAWLYFSSFPICSVRFFCFLTRHLINYASVNCLWFLLSSVSLQSNWAWKTLKFGLSTSSFSVSLFSSLLTL